MLSDSLMMIAPIVDKFKGTKNNEWFLVSFAEADLNESTNLLVKNKLMEEYTKALKQSTTSPHSNECCNLT